MTVSTVAGAGGQVAAAQRRADHWDRHDSRVKLGQVLDVRVLQQFSERKYLVSFGGEQHVVESAMALTAGRTVRTTVVAVGDKLELKYTGSAEPSMDRDDSESNAAEPSGDLLTDLQAQHAVTLNDTQRSAISNAMNAAAQPELMASGGLYLSKLSLAIESEALDALYAAQAWKAEGAGTMSAAAQTPGLDLTQLEHLEPLAAVLRQLFEAQNTSDSSLRADELALPVAQQPSLPLAASDLSGSDVDQNGRGHDLARQLLNESDGGSLAYHYGVLPVLIADQLVELDVVYFHERTRSDRSSNSRRLVMTFNTERLGRVEIVAQAVADRLSVAITSDSTQSKTTLAAHADEVTNLLSRLGWDVDAIKYEFDPQPVRAAGQVIAHVLNSDTLDRLV